MFCNWLQEYLINSIEMLRKLCVHYWQCITFLSFASGVYYLVLLSPILIRWRKYYVRFCILHVMILVLISTQLLYASESRRSVVRALREQLCNEGKTRSDTMRTLRLVEISFFYRPCPFHRFSFSTMGQLPSLWSEIFQPICPQISCPTRTFGFDESPMLLPVSPRLHTQGQF